MVECISILLIVDSRWLERSVPPSPYEYPAFNAGPRTCLGRGLAELEGVYVLVGVLMRYRIELVEGHKVEYGNSLTLPMQHGLKVRLHER